MNKLNIYVVIVVGLLVVGIIGGYHMREALPYDFEVIPMDKGFQIINTTTWADKDCTVLVTWKTGSKKDILTAKSKALKIVGLVNNQSYKISIRRNDILGKLRYRKAEFTAKPDFVSNYAVLVGASIGKSWNIRELKDRENAKGWFWGYRGYYEFDKTPVIKSIIEASVKPKIVIIKECATYFPLDTQRGIDYILQWVKMLRSVNIKPVIATVIPITKKRSEINPQQMESINAMNKAIRELKSNMDLDILDLNAALAKDMKNGFLNEAYANKDGLHINEKGYRNILDGFMVKFCMNNE